MGRKGDLGRGRGAGGPANRGREGALRSMTAPAGVCTVRTIWRRASEGPFLRAKFTRFPSSRPLLSPGKVSSLHAGARPGAKRGCPPLLPHHLPCSLPLPEVHKPCLGVSSGVAAWAALSLGFLADADTQKAGKQKAR